MVFNTPDGIAALTPNSPFERLPDGRPHVPADLLERTKLVSTDGEIDVPTWEAHIEADFFEWLAARGGR